MSSFGFQFQFFCQQSKCHVLKRNFDISTLMFVWRLSLSLHIHLTYFQIRTFRLMSFFCWLFDKMFIDAIKSNIAELYSTIRFVLPKKNYFKNLLIKTSKSLSPTMKWMRKKRKVVLIFQHGPLFSNVLYFTMYKPSH